MDHPQEPTWIPYEPPPSNPFQALLRQYGFGIALVLFMGVLLGGLVLGSSEHSRSRATSGVPTAAAPPLLVPSGVQHPFAGEAALSVTTQPRGAVVRIDRQIVGRAPLSGRGVPAGVHLLSIVKEGYAPMDSIIILRTGANPHVSVTLRSLPGYIPKADPVPQLTEDRVPHAITPQAPHIQQGWLTSDSTRRAHLRHSVKRALERRPGPTGMPVGW